MTSYFPARFPSSNARGNTTSNGNSYCSRIQRVHPDGIEPPYWSARAMRSLRSGIASPAGRVPTPSKLSPRSAASLSTISRVLLFPLMKKAPADGPDVSHATSSPAASNRLIAVKESLTA